MAKKSGKNEAKTSIIDQWIDRDLSDPTAIEPDAGALLVDEELRNRATAILRSGRTPLLWGDVGVGKSVLIEAIVAEQRTAEWASLRVIELSFRRRAAAFKKPGEELGPDFHKFVKALKAEDPIVVVIADMEYVYSYDLEPLLDALLAKLPGRCVLEGRGENIPYIFEYWPEFERLISRMVVSEPSPDECRRQLEVRYGSSASSEAVDSVVTLANRYLGRQLFPSKAVNIIESARAAHSVDIVENTHVIDFFAQQQRIPRLLVDFREALKPKELHARLASAVLGQQEAVHAMSQLVMRISAGMCDDLRPFGTYAFVGPTGVGKTHLVHRLAEVLFGHRDRAIRVDMADFSDEGAAGRLFGNPMAQSLSDRRGLLTARLTGNAFGIILLDELEKAHTAVYDGLLPLLDEGVYRNGAGENIGCRSFVIIATSNAGAELHRGSVLGFLTESDSEERLRDAIDQQLREHFRFEFLNRFDEIVHFHALDRAAIREIAARELQRLASRSGLRQRGLRLEYDEAVLDHLAVHGYDPLFGARFLRRTIEREATTPIASCMMRTADGDTVRLMVRGKQLRAEIPELTTSKKPETEAQTDVEINDIEQALALAQQQAGELVERRQHMLAELNAHNAWSEPNRYEQELREFRHLDVAVAQAQRWLRRAENLPAMPIQDEPGHAGLSTQTKWMAAAREILEDWHERRLAEVASQVWLVIASTDPGRPDPDWVLHIAEMEVAWCQQLGLEVDAVAWAEQDDGRLRIALEIEGAGADAILAMEAGVHRLLHATEPNKRAVVSVVQPGEGVALQACTNGRGQRGPLQLRAAFQCRGEVKTGPHTAQGERWLWFGADKQAITAFLQQWCAQSQSESPDTARTYNDKGAGARDPRTGATIARFADVMDGKLRQLWRSWRSR